MSDGGDGPGGHRSGFVTFVGRPNAGKSTLLNQILGEKVSIVSDKPQTTRNQIRGILDRMESITETDASGSHEVLVITDYKTGKAPPERYANKAFFALKIYALLIRTVKNITPDRVRLLYLNGPTEYTMDINDQQLDAMEKQLAALWGTINKAILSGIWPARTSALCDYCDFKKDLCPAWNDV